MWLNHLTTKKQAKDYAVAKKALEKAWPEKGTETFETKAAYNDMLIAWSHQRFGRRLRLAGARFAYRLKDWLPDAKTDRLVHGGLINEEVGVLKSVSKRRRATGWFAIAYAPLAVFGALSFSALVLTLQLPPLAKALTIPLFWVAFVGHFLHAKFVLFDSMIVWRAAKKRRIEKRMRQEV